jgi:CheY-like chemotaxis protein
LAALAVTGILAAAILLRDLVRLERHALTLEGSLEELKRELRQLAETSERDQPVAVGGREGPRRVGREVTDEARRESMIARPVIGIPDTMERPLEAPAPAQPGPKRVLVVEDNEVNALLALKSLERLKALVDWARDGLEAVAMVEESFSGARPTYDLVLMDIRMPRLDGLEATRRIRRLETALSRPEPVRIAALTATTMRQDRVAAQAAGINEFLAKPYSAGSLEKLLTATPEQQAEAS